MNPNITVPSSETIASFFALRTMEFKSTFGGDRLVKTHPMLSFNMVVKRIYLNPFIANMIPILIVALIMFVVLYVCCSTKHGHCSTDEFRLVEEA